MPGRRQSRKPRNWADLAERPVPYNPLALVNLGRSVELALLACKPVPITSVPLTVGAGVYALYYHGEHSLYRPISDRYGEVPIYVGKSVPAGGRKGLVDQSREETPLWGRLQEHKESLEQVHDLDERDFSVRYLVAVEVFVPLAERVMIRQLRPVWNVVVDGFGNHDPGARRRREGQRPPWDELHPGRWWSLPENMPTPSLVSAAESRSRIQRHLAEHASIEQGSLAAPNAVDSPSNNGLPDWASALGWTDGDSQS
ncbi:Eco29kI family restriction endonuclease [Micromonospora orduensis]|uniref:Eco29kI family restriction endonuclease n=1 Tax=Micromonospora orduensis TaxID=1420891 RepID=UPI0033DE9B25